MHREKEVECELSLITPGACFIFCNVIPSLKLAYVASSMKGYILLLNLMRCLDGIFLSIVACIVAACIEKKRLNVSYHL